MLYIKRDAEERFDEEKQEFINTKALSLVLEHSLISISKWESKWHVPFLDDRIEKTEEQIRDYIRCMNMTQCTPDEVFDDLPLDVIKEVYDYIEDPASATTFQDYRPNSMKGPKNMKKPETLTSELIYYWLVAYQIPFDCQKWNLSRLMNLVKICALKAEEQNPNSKGKMNRKDILARNAQINAARRAKYHTSG